MYIFISVLSHKVFPYTSHKLGGKQPVPMKAMVKSTAFGLWASPKMEFKHRRPPGNSLQFAVEAMAQSKPLIYPVRKLSVYQIHHLPRDSTHHLPRYWRFSSSSSIFSWDFHGFSLPSEWGVTSIPKEPRHLTCWLLCPAASCRGTPRPVKPPQAKTQSSRIRPGKTGVARWCPSSLAKLVQISTISLGLIRGLYRTSYWDYKPTYNWGGGHHLVVNVPIKHHPILGM